MSEPNEPGYVTPHALERYREFYPRASGGDAALTFSVSDEVDPQIARRMVGRDWDRRQESGQFRLHPERTGLFVYMLPEETRSGQVVVCTFLRFYSKTQHDLAVRLYGPKEQLTGCPPWASTLGRAAVGVDPNRLPDDFVLSQGLKNRGASVEWLLTFIWSRPRFSWEETSVFAGGKKRPIEWYTKVPFPRDTTAGDPVTKVVGLYLSELKWRACLVPDWDPGGAAH